MAPTKSRTPSPDSEGMFAGMVVYLIESGVQARRLQIWKQKLVQMGATIEDHLTKRVTDIFAMTADALHQQLDGNRLARFKGNILSYRWLEDSLRVGEKVSGELYNLKVESERGNILGENMKENSLNPSKGNNSSSDEPSQSKKIRPSPEDLHTERRNDRNSNAVLEAPDTSRGSDDLSYTLSLDDALHSTLPYCPPDFNKNITEIFGKLINIYRALGDDRRSFSYYKAIGVIEKLPFKIENADQVKDLPTIGKSLQDHIQEIVTTGKLSKLEHFEADEKIKEALRTKTEEN